MAALDLNAELVAFGDRIPSPHLLCYENVTISDCGGWTTMLLPSIKTQENNTDVVTVLVRGKEASSYGPTPPPRTSSVNVVYLGDDSPCHKYVVPSFLTKSDSGFSDESHPQTDDAAESEDRTRFRVDGKFCDDNHVSVDNLGSKCVDSDIFFQDGVRLRDDRRSREPKGSRRSSTDSSEDGFSQNYRDLRHELREVEDKFRKAMVANAGLDNEKAALNYQVELLKDKLEECEEATSCVARELRDKNRQHQLLSISYKELHILVDKLRVQLDEQQNLMTERGLTVVGAAGDDRDVVSIEDGDDDEVSDVDRRQEQNRRTKAIVSIETAAILTDLGDGPLDVRIKRLADERDDLQDSVRRLKLDLEEERCKNNRLDKFSNSNGSSSEETERETKKILEDYKFKFQKVEQDSNTLQTTVARLESQVIRYRNAAETAEKSEEELKAEKRRLQRELRETTTRMEEFETANKHLETRLGKLKTAKSNLLKEL